MKTSIYTDTLAEVHVGDTVRYAYWDFGDRGKFCGKTGTVTEIRPVGALGVHFPHYPKGTNLVAGADKFRLVTCTHAGPETIYILENVHGQATGLFRTLDSLAEAIASLPPTQRRITLAAHPADELSPGQYLDLDELPAPSGAWWLEEEEEAP